MAKAKFRSVYGKNGSGRFVVSEGIAPSEYLHPHDALPTLFRDDEDDRFEVVISKGTILSLVTDSNGDSRMVPAGGGSANVYTGEEPAVNLSAADSDGLATGGDANVGVPVGCAQYNLYRPFDKGTSQGAGWITHGYVEWPLVQGLNDNLAAGDKVVSDGMGRPVKAGTTGAGTDVVGKVIAVEKFATNFDDGLLSYMQLPSDPGALREVYSLTKTTGAYAGRMGIRANLDVEGVVGAFRVYLTL